MDHAVEGTCRTPRTLLNDGAFPRRQGLDEAPDGLGEGAAGTKDPHRRRRLSVDGAYSRHQGRSLNVVGDGGARSVVGSGDFLDGGSPSRKTRSTKEGLRDGDPPSGKLLAGSSTGGGEGLMEKIRRRRQSVGGALRVRASSSPERLKIEELSHPAEITIVRSPGFVSGATKLFPLSQTALSLPRRALSIDGALRTRLKIEDFINSAATTITRSAGSSFASSAKKHLPPSPGAESPNSQFEFRRTQQDLPPALNPFCPIQRQNTKLDVTREVEWVRDSLRETADQGVLLGAALALSLDHSLVRNT